MRSKPVVLLRHQAYIDGHWLDAADGATFAVTDPASGACIARVSDMGAEACQQAIRAAQRALPAWRAQTAKQRGLILRRWYDLIGEHRQALAQLLSREQGKPHAEALAEIAYGASFIEWFAEEGKRTYGETIPSPLPGQRISTIKQPIGVVAAITPWNFPNAMITRKVAPALAAGCCVVLKPAPETPLSALALAALAEAAGLPAGVLNIVPGLDAAAIGTCMTQSPLVRKLSFTGSTRIGKLLMAQSAATVKKLSLELGGNAPFIVFDDADLEAAVQGALAAKFRNSGQTCICANRILVQAGIYERFVARFAEVVATLRVGPASDPRAQQGPLINQAALDKVQALIDDALARGATLVSGGAPHPLGGLFFQPTILCDVDESMRITHEEAFGPVAPLIKFHDEQGAIRLANQTESGLAAYFYARDIGRIYRVAEALECGMVGINEGLISNELAPFGGIKQSGLGREGSRYGIEDYLEVKYLCFGGLDDKGTN
ncbi:MULTISPECIES: NAD-dependent succinate-semialdehyde dehydrogenase [Edwardsiella]|uniref:5-carboxymethyl-2-hydroxymuconate semialdehyde dehydrogenase n=2 Tax=Edwardsiella anguillarum TaxID=1821960 RepID=A0A076LP74_9GAMM|nr:MULTISPECIES: NAD-dependent succinate-semialdehyde dehydrogenase [Edwardsiella]AIJ09681.1 5-carboxymethyl-2-hydroxymuconate semialdehyde dehydrogenase [Edwardsiella anguillarum ET080813]AKR77412.1 NAD-dependent succinate-semialdehyde dehydrogenase [Edwardsiella sp. LADL05-105]KAB0592637.1 NAD-dependent succinate-semialdehyde dehydrogenase [Edwardsiella anguillarum]UOU80458.1 NAD-dependent succinate-semialdehyde dehydrogenase [Edwardsiella anguillarum]WHP85147.1 NAD-dependent succinate-semia